MRSKTLPEYQSPQNETPTGRLLLVFLATFVVLILFQPLLKKFGLQPQPQPQPQQQQQVQTAPQPAPVTQPPAVAAAPAAVSVAKRKGRSCRGCSAARTKQADAETETVIESDLYKITFTNRGGQVKSWILKKYNDDKGHPLDLVHSVAAPAVWPSAVAVRVRRESAKEAGLGSLCR